MRKHQPTEEQRRTVKEAAGLGLPQKLICPLVGLSDDKTLAIHYRNELDMGMAEAGQKVTRLLMQKIEGGDSAMITFYCKTQLGWRETKEEENKQPVNIYVNGKEVNL
jgi:hypothetical protein